EQLFYTEKVTGSSPVSPTPTMRKERKTNRRTPKDTGEHRVLRKSEVTPERIRAFFDNMSASHHGRFVGFDHDCSNDTVRSHSISEED
ncbi:MAG: hypothetical protein AAB573_03000, partial [Patescibacteria group bacterium]